MSKINIFKEPIGIDLSTLINTRLLICANSGGGKSYAVRKLLEESHGKVMSIVLDIEGEFKTLREKYDFLLIGDQNSDVQINLQAAKLLPKKLLELNVSTIIDVSDLKRSERITYVKHFLESLMDLPRKYWKPCIVILDEVHVLAGQQEKADSCSSVIDLMTRGRKRGYCGIGCTQRISKLHKDVVAECLPPEQEIVTTEGLKPIRDIRLGDFVLTHKGRFKKVKKIFKRRYKGDLIAIKSQGNNLTLRVTPEHPIFVSNKKLKWIGNKVKERVYPKSWVVAKDVGVLSYLPFPKIRKECVPEEIKMIYEWLLPLRNGKLQLRKRQLKTKITKQLMRLAGYYVSEGSTSKQKNRNAIRTEFSFGVKDEAMIVDCQNILRELGLKSNAQQNKANCIKVQLNNSALGQWFVKQFGRGAENKKIPLWMKYLPVELILEFMKAYMDGDGYRFGTCEIGRTISKQLAFSLRDLGLKIGYTVNVYKYAPHPTSNFIQGRRVNSKDFYVIQMKKELGKTGSIARDEWYMYPKVKSISSEYYEGFVFNLDVADDNSYCTTYHTVHNCNNVMIGRTGLDIDMKRAGEILGFTNKTDILSLRNLEAGEFHAFGPAISREVKKVKVATVKTTHPKVGMDLKEIIVPPTPKIKSMLSKLNELPQKAVEELKTTSDLKRRIRELEYENRKKPVTKTIIDEEATDRARNTGYNEGMSEARSELTKSSKRLSEIENALKRISLIIKSFSEETQINIHTPQIIPKKQFEKKYEAITETEIRPTAETFEGEKEKISGGALRMLKACAMYLPRSVSKPRIATLSGLSYKSGTFGTYMGSLKRNNYIEGYGKDFIITEEGLEAVGDIPDLPKDPQSLINMWCNIVKGGASRMLKALFEAHPHGLSKEELGEQADLSPISGTFGTYLGTLKRNGLITVQGQEIRIAKELMEE